MPDLFGRLFTAAALSGGLVLSAPAPAAVDWMPAGSLRVCADGNALPYSNEAGEGFENRLAEMIAEDLGVPVTYTWWPNTMGFVSNTLFARKCDVVLGTAAGNDMMQNTNPYYRSAYALVYRDDSGLSATTLSDPQLQGARIGVVERTPPATLLNRYGLHSIEPYHLNTDTRVHQPARDAIEHVAAGLTDAAVVWGPLAGYWAERQDVPLAVVPLVDEPGPVRLDFNMTMGIRIDEPEWKHWLNDWIAAHQDEIDALLADYHVPLLDRRGQVKTVAAAAVPMPDGYRRCHCQYDPHGLRMPR